MHVPKMVTILVVLWGVFFQASFTSAANLTLPTGGLVTIELLNSDAQFSNTLSVTFPNSNKNIVAVQGCSLESVTGLPAGSIPVGSEKPSQRGCRVVLDADKDTPGLQGFAAGATLEFHLCAQTNADSACEFVWSSDRTKNSDNFDHLRITPQVDFPDRIFQLAWEDLPNGGDNDFNDFIGMVRVDIDTDGDGLWDDWETRGIDTDGDPGTPTFQLPDADPRRKDIYVEIDYMDCAVGGGDCALNDGHSHRPSDAAIRRVIQAFADAPVLNPSGVSGIALHIDLNEAIPHHNVLNFTGAGGIDFDAVKAAHFGSANPRRFAYHYALFTHYDNASPALSFTGLAEIGGNDFYVSLGGTATKVGTVEQQAGTLMHELGHNLGLRHGGDKDTNLKPNYISVMNYAFQEGIPPNGSMDYSKGGLAALDERSLIEAKGIEIVGIANAAHRTKYACANLTVGLNVPIDWNCNGSKTETLTSTNINGDCINPSAPNRAIDCRIVGAIQAFNELYNPQDPNDSNGPLHDYNDWGKMTYAFQNSKELAEGVHITPNLLDELTEEKAAQLRVLSVGIDIKPDGVPNSINIHSHGVIPVAILSSSSFNAVKDVDVASLRFGHIGTEPSLRFCSKMPVDVNADGLGDLFCHFETAAANFEIGDAQGILSGLTTTNLSFMGSDSIRIVGENGHHREHHHKHHRKHDRDHDRDDDHDDKDDDRH